MLGADLRDLQEAVRHRAIQTAQNRGFQPARHEESHEKARHGQEPVGRGTLGFVAVGIPLGLIPPAFFSFEGSLAGSIDKRMQV